MTWNTQGIQSRNKGNRVSVSQAQQKSYSEIPTSLRFYGSQANLESTCIRHPHALGANQEPRCSRYSNAQVNSNQKFDRNPT